jgi:protein-disulfide isomerase
LNKLLKLPTLLLLTLSATAQESPQNHSQQQSRGPAGTNSVTQTTPAPSTAQGPTERRIESYLRHLYAWGPDFKLTVSPLKESSVAGLYEASVDVSKDNQKDTATVYVSKDGRYLVRGEVADMNADPLAENRSKMHLENNPSTGPLSAPVTIVEFSDFQCPSCRQLHDVLKTVTADYSQVRLVFKDFPLTQIHPWAMTASIAARCAYQQNPQAFWKVYDSIFASQQVISPDNAWQKMLDFGTQAGLEQQSFRACMSNPEAAQAIQENMKEGQSLAVASTPTVFINGRRLVGPDRSVLDQYIHFELNAGHSPPQPAPKR